MKSLKTSSEGLDKINKAIEQIQTEKGWAVDNENWLDEASKFLPIKKIGDTEVPGTVSIGTWKRFRSGHSIKPINFQAFCQVLGLNWEEIVDTIQYYHIHDSVN